MTAVIDSDPIRAHQHASETPSSESAVQRPGGVLAGSCDRLQRWYWAAPTLLSVVIGSVGAATPSLWADELATWSATGRSWSQLWTLLGNLDAVAAPYYVFMHVWVQIFGDSEFALRAPSIIAIAATAGLIAVLGRRLYSVKVGVIAGVLFTIMPGITRLAQEARVTSFAVMFAVVATLALIGAVERPRWWRWIGYSAALLGLGASNLIALMILAPHAIFVAVRWWQGGGDRRVLQLAWWPACVVVPLLVLSPMMYFSHQQTYQLSWVERPSWTVFSKLPELPGAAALGGALIALALVGIPLAGRAQSLLIAWLVVPPVVLFAVSVVGSQSYWVVRYLSFLMPCLALLAALGLSRLKLRHAALTVAVLSILMVPAHLSVRGSGSHGGFNGPEVERYISERLQPGDVAVYPDVDSHAPRSLIAYYGPSSQDLPDVLAVNSGEETGWYGPSECAPADCLAAAQRIWMVRWYPFDDDPFGTMNNPAKEAYLRSNFAVVETEKIGEITLLLLQRT